MTQAKEIATTNTTELAPAQGVSPLVQMLATGQFTPDQVSQMIDLQAKYDRHEAEKAYHAAMARFRAEVTNVVKDRKGHNSMYATLGAVMRTISKPLSDNGFNVSWTDAQDHQASAITVTCTVTHAMGHSESTSLTSEYETSGNKNAIQAIASAKSYLNRYTLMGLLGLATEDDDGQCAVPAPVEIISESELADLESLVDETGGNVRQWKAWVSRKYPSNGDYIAIPKADVDGLVKQIHAAAKKREAK